MRAPATADRADTELIACYLRGEEQAATEAGGTARRAARPVPGRAGGARGELEDIVQDALFRAFRARGVFRGGASFRTWLLTIG